MKLPWFSSEKSSQEKTEPIEQDKKSENKKTYKISTLPENLQKIAILIQQTDKEIAYLQKKLALLLTTKKELEKNLKGKLNSIKD